MSNSGSHFRTAIVRPRPRNPTGAAIVCRRAIGLMIVGLLGCQFPAGFPSFSHSNSEQAQSVPLVAVQPTPVPTPTPTESAETGSDSAVSRRAAKAAVKARVAAEKAAAASRAAVLASNEAAQAAADAAVAAGLSAGGSNSGHRKKASKRDAQSVAMSDQSRPSTAVVSTSVKAATDSESATNTAAPASPAASLSPPAAASTPAPNLVSAADVDQVQATQAEAAQLIDKADASLKRVARGQLNSQDAERYDQATKLLKSARDSFAQEDYVAAHSLANKAVILLRLLPAAGAS
jgi:hypothetical protein